MSREQLGKNLVDGAYIPNLLVGTLALVGGGNTYYVNNILGKSTNTGLDPTLPMDQVNTAITASEAYRLSQSNIYLRNKIMVVGTGTAYSPITSMPNYTDIVGIGATPWGDGTGIVIIGASSGGPSNGGNTSSRGCTWTNIQFQTGGNYYALEVSQLLRSEFSRCCFRTSGAASYGGIHITGNSGGNWIHDCRIEGDSGIPVTGITIASGVTFNDGIIEYCVIGGTTNGLANASGDDTGTIWRYNYFGAVTGTCAVPVADTGANGLSIYYANYSTGQATWTMTNNPGRALDNHQMTLPTTPVKIYAGT
jgi:hypothetical protein